MKQSQLLMKLPYRPRALLCMLLLAICCWTPLVFAVVKGVIDTFVHLWKEYRPYFGCLKDLGVALVKGEKKKDG